MTRSKLSKAAISLWFVVSGSLISQEAIAQAYPNHESTVCELGYINVFSHMNGEDSFFEVSADHTGFKTQVSNASKRKLPGGAYLTQMWERDNKTTFVEIWHTLMLAAEQRLAVRITSTDGNCSGPHSEFMVTLCSNEGDCDYGVSAK
jgi:hypothetical protein